MIICNECGKKIDINEHKELKLCIHCGSELMLKEEKAEPGKRPGIVWWGLFASIMIIPLTIISTRIFFITPLYTVPGFILSIMALWIVKREKLKGKIVAIISIIISSVSLFLTIILILSMMVALHIIK